MPLHLIFIIILTLNSLQLFSQGLYENEQKVNLFKNRINKVEVFKNGQLNHEIEVDTILKIIEIHSIRLKSANKTLTAYTQKFFFNKFELVDSVIYILCAIDADTILEPLRLTCLPDTSILHYNYTQTGRRLINRKNYVLKNNTKKIRSVDYFGYDDKRRLVLMLQNDGQTQFYYTYDDKDCIIKEVVGNTNINYEYNSQGQLTGRKIASQSITYEYFQNKLLKRKTIKGTDSGVWTYDYK